LFPEAYCLDTNLINVLLERTSNFDIFWFHWPTDGIFRNVEDYEPIILIYKKEDICSIIVRRQWKYIATNNSETKIANPVRIFFDPFQHHPFLITNSTLHNYISFSTLLTYQHIEIDKNIIPEQFRTGINHPSNIMNRIIKDPSDYANDLYKDICE